MSRGLVNNMLTMNNLGDGSTLSLDFTAMGGVLDPRLTFSRASTATFVNSSGYVEWAASNEMTYSQSQDSETWWNRYGTNVVRTAGQTDPNGRTSAVKLVYTATAGDAVISRSVPTNIGISYTISMWMRADSGTLTNVRFARAATPTGAFFPTLTTIWQRVSLSFTATNASDGIEIRVLNSGSPQTATFHVYGAQLESGSTVRTYQPALAAAAYYAPRFDYSPTNIGEPRGLLVEGQTQNVLYYSQDVTQATRWTIQGGIPSSYTSVSATGGTAPDNTNTANLCTESTANNSRSIYQGLTAAAGTYTASVWVKAGTGSTRYIRLVLPSAAGNFVYVTVNISTGAVTQAAAAVGTASAASATVTSYPGSWYHIRLTGTLAAAVNFVFIVPLDSATPSVNTGDYGREAYLGNGSTFLIWGAQLEAGSGASSYIPTGASQVTRNRDTAVMSNISALNYTNAAGTLFVDFTNNTENANYSGSIAFNNGANYAQRFRLGVGSLLVSYFQTNGITGLGTNLFGARTSFARAKAASSYSFDGTTTTTLMSMNGAAASVTPSSSAAASVSIPTNLSLNSDNSSGALDYVSMTIRSIKYFPTAKSLVDMNGLTT
jgi:hypothetical protein